MQTIKNYTHITQDFCLYLKLKKKSKNYRKPHIEQKNNHNLHYNKGKFSAFFKKPAAVRCQSKSLLTKFISLVLKDFL